MSEKITHNAAGQIASAELDLDIAIPRPLTLEAMDKLAFRKRDPAEGGLPSREKVEANALSLDEKAYLLNGTLAIAKQAFGARLAAVLLFQDVLATKRPQSHEELDALAAEVRAAVDNDYLFMLGTRHQRASILEALTKRLGGDEDGDGEGGLSLCDCEGPEDCPHYERDKGSKLKAQGIKPSPAVH